MDTLDSYLFKWDAGYCNKQSSCRNIFSLNICDENLRNEKNDNQSNIEFATIFYMEFFLFVLYCDLENNAMIRYSRKPNFCHHNSTLVPIIFTIADINFLIKKIRTV